MLAPVTLTTERLLLRPWRASDREPFAELNADPEVMEFLPATPRAVSDEHAGRVDSHFQQHGYGFWAVEERGGRPFVGFVGLWHTSFASHFTPCIEVGWRLARSAWGRGYASEGAREAVRFGFEDLGLTELVAITVPANVRSRHVMEKLGMQRDLQGDFEHPQLPEGHPLRSHVLYRLSRPQWQAGRPG
jgi:RimJ/RimL family protein N-acetyltransferase